MLSPCCSFNAPSTAPVFSRFATLASLLTLGLWMLFAPTAHAQCPDDNEPWLTWIFTTEGQTASTACIFSGEHNVLHVIAGSTYEVNTCGTPWDTQLTIYDTSTGALVGYNDDGCGAQSTVTFTAAQNGVFLLLMDDASCSVVTGTECGYMSATLVNMGIPGACANAITAVSGEVYDFNLASGNGELNPSDGPNGTPGDEVVYEFTATVNGTHNVTVTNDDGLVDLFVGELCSEDDFTFIEQVTQFHLHSLDLVAGTTYYFLVDDQNTTTNSGTFSITDPNYCGSGINESHALLANDTLAIQDNTADLPDCCFFQPSNDATYELIVPESGSLWISACGSAFDTYMYLSTSTCGGTTLAENDDFCGSQSLIEVDVPAGTYYVTLEGSQDTEMGAFELEILYTPFAPYSVHSKHASSQQGEDLKYGSAVAMSGDVLVVADEQEHVEVLRKAGDGSWSLETVISAPSSDISFGAREALATNGDWIAIGAKTDDTYGNNAGAVHLYHYDGLDWQYEGSLSHMAPFGSIIADLFGMALAMDGNRMVVGSRAENGVGAAGAVHYFEYNSMLGMWLESGFIASTHTSGNSTSKFAESVDISGDYMIVGEHRNNTNGNFAGAAYIYSFYNQCWHQQNVFYGHNADDILGKDVAISGATAVAGSPFADTGGLNEAGAVTMYRLLPSTGGDSAWAETAHFAPEGTAQGDWVGSAVDIDGSLLAVGVPRDDEFPINGGAGYFLFDCTGGSLDCVNEGFACDAMQNDRLGFDVAVSGELAAIGATLDDNIYDDAGSVYILGANDIGFECDLTAPGDTETDLISADDSGASASDDTTRHTTPDFDVFLPGGSGLSVTEGYLAQAGDAVVFYREGTGDSTIVILSDSDIDNGFYNFEFVYPGPVLEDGEYTFCSYLIDAFGNMGPTDCLDIVIDNEDPEPLLDFGTSPIAGSDTTLYLDNNGNVVLSIESSDNISATDNIAMDTLYADVTDFDCSDAGSIVTVTLTAIDLAGNISTTTFDVAIEDDTAPVVSVQNVTVQLQMTGTGSLTAAQVDNGTTDNCGIDNLAISQTTFDCDDVGDQTVVFTATDLSGNTTTANFTVTVEFNQAPSANAQDVTLELDADGNASTTAAAVDNGSGSACAIGSLSLSQTDFTCADLGPNTVTLTVIDSYGNVSTATATVTVVDLLAPTAVAQNVTVQLDAAGEGSLTAAEVDNGTIENCSLDNLSISQTDFDCTDVGTTTLELSARDISGNTGETNFTVTVEDNVLPAAIAQNLTIQLDASGNAATTAEAVDNGSSDACGIASLSLSQTDFGCGDLGDNTVTLTVTDNNGNVSTTTAVVTVEDTAPTIAIAQDLTIELDAAGIAFITAAQADNGSNDPCGIAAMTVSQSGFDCDDLGDNDVVFSATDVNNNTATVTFTVTVQDNIAPTLSGTPANITQSAAGGTCSAAVTWTDPTASDNCSAALTSTHSSGDTFAVGITTVTFTATDIAGNTTTSSFTVTLTDDEAPVISDMPTDITQTNDAGNCSAVVNWTAPTAADNCGIDSMVGDAASGDTFPVGTTTVAYTATDIHGNSTAATFTVTVTDDEAPVISGLPANITQTADAGQCTADVTWTAPTAADFCGIASFTADAAPGDAFAVGTTTVTYTATDIHGNSTTGSFDITVTDDESPAIAGMPSNITQSNDAGICGAAVSWTAPTGTDNCTVASLTSTHDIGDTFAVGTTTVTYTVTDLAGNTATSSFTVTVTDDEAPVISNIPADFTVLTSGGLSTAVVTWPEAPAADPAASDNCGVTSFTSTHASGDTFNEGITTVTYTAMDAAGNTTTSSFTVTVSDGEAPVISGNPTDITQTAEAGACSAVVYYTAPTATDNVAVASFSGDAASGDTFPVGTTTVTYTAIDDAGNTTTSDFTVTITDDEAPVIAAGGGSGEGYALGPISDSGNGTIQEGWTGGAQAYFQNDATDDETVTDAEANSGNNSWFLSNAYNNPGQGSPHAPSLGLPSGTGPGTVFTLELYFKAEATGDGDGSTHKIYQGTYAGDDRTGININIKNDTDASGDGLNISTYSYDAGTGAFPATTIASNLDRNVWHKVNVTYTIDASGDPSLDTAVYSVDDGAGVSANTWMNVWRVANGYTQAYGDNIAWGGASNATGFYYDDITYSSDFDGSSQTIGFEGASNDFEDITLSNDAGICGAVATWTEPTATDNCGLASLTGTHASGATFAVGTTTVTYTALDIHGNTATSSITVTVTDDEDPSITGTPANISLNNDAGNCTAVASWTAPTAADNCGIASFTSDYNSGAAFPVGTTTVTYTATDIHSNTTTSTFTVTVTDNEQPTISGMPANISLNNDAGNCTALANWTAPTAADNCGIATFTSDYNSGAAFPVGTTTVTYTATDIHSNTSTATFTVTVTDNEQPTFSGMPANITQTADAGECEADVTWTAPTAADNCAIATFTSDANPGDAFAVGTTTVTYTATDIHGNSSTGSFTITVTDDEAPAISGTPANITQTADAGQCSTSVNYTAPTATDNCGMSAFYGDATSGDIFPVGTTTITYTASDIHGNVNTASFTVTVTDDENPVISPTAEDQTYQRDGNEGAAYSAWIAGYGGAAATDNCGIDAWSDNSTGLSDDCGSTGTETVTFTVTDIHSNSSSTTATFTVIDDFAPSCPVIDLTDGSDNGLSGTDDVTNDDTPTMRVIFTGSGVESAEEGDIVELYIGGVLFETQTVTDLDVANGYAEFETGPFADGAVSFSARHIDDCAQASIFAFLNIVIHTTDPAALADGLTLYLDPDGNASIEAEDLDDGSSDDFTAVAFSASQTAFTCADLGDNTVTLTVTDIAGNTATAAATVTVVDNIDPIIVASNITKQLDAAGSATLTLSEVASITDNCTVASSSIDIESLDCSDVGEVTITITAADQSGNTSSATATVTVEDNVAPTLVLADAVLYLDEEGAASIMASDLDNGSSDACGIAGFNFGAAGADGPDMTYGCGDTGINTMTVQVEDVNGNVTSGSVNVTVLDTLSPVLNIFDLEDYTMYAGESCANMVNLFAAGSPWYEATDNCSFSVEILYDEINETGIAGCREFDRRWVIQATDASGNMSSDTTLQHIIVIDTTAPTVFLDGVPADVSVDLDANCNGEMPVAAAVTASATDNCSNAPTVGVVSYVDSAPAYLCGDAGSYTIVRTYMASATDDCGNSGMASATQTVTFNDVTPPQITDSEGIMNGGSVTQEEQLGLFDFIFIPNPIDLEVEDACGSASYELVETIGGYVPTDDIGNYCAAATPEAYLNGESCVAGAPAAMVLEGAPFNGASFSIIPGGVNIVEGFFDETMSIEVEVQNAAGTGGFIWNADYNAAFNWQEWQALGRGYKKDCPQVLAGSNVWTFWDYFVMQTGGMIGTGIYAGSELSLTHQPTNYFYGMQVGYGANNQNANYGASAWFYWSGELVVDGASQGFLGSSGDIMLDLDCVLPWTAAYDYTITDDCGNSATFGYAVTNAAVQPDAPTVSGGESGHQPFDVSVSGDLKEPIRVTGLLPNPTNNVSQLGFVVSNNMRLRVDLYDMAGQLVQELYDGNAMSDVEYFMTVDAGGLDAGMYQIRISSNSYMAVKKLLVTQ